MDPHRRNQPTTAAISAVTPAAVAPDPTSPKLDPTTPLSDSDNLSKSSHPRSPKVDSISLHPQAQLKMVGPKTVQKVTKTPHQHQHSTTTEKFNDSEEKFERMINCITAKESEMKQLLQEHEHLTRRLSVSLSSSRSGRRRSSICGSQIQLADVFANNGVKVVSADMPPFMQIHAVDCARKTHDSMEKFTSKSLALTLKKEFDGVYGPAWHCIVGKSFGSFVTHSVGGFMYFSMAQKLYILLFKTTVQRAK